MMVKYFLKIAGGSLYSLNDYETILNCVLQDKIELKSINLRNLSNTTMRWWPF